MHTDLSLNIKKKIEVIFKHEAFTKYNELSFDSKNKTTPNDFHIKLNEASRAITTIIDWAFPHFLQLIGALLSCVIIFVRQELYLLGFIIIVLNIIIYLKIIKKLQNEYFKGRTQRKKENNRTNNIISLYLPLFQYKEKNVSNMLQLEEKFITNDNISNKEWSKISLVTSFSNNIGILIFGLFYNTSTIKLLIMLNILYQFKHTVSETMNFMNWYSRIDMEYATYENFWKELDFAVDPIKLDLPSVITITNINIQQDSFKVLFHENTSSITINEKDKILISGKSGHGKTTFINGLMGKIKGIEFSENYPENYYHHFVEFYQVIKEKMPTSTVTIRQLFNDESDDNLIIYCCKICHVYDDFICKLVESKKNKNSNDCVIDMKSNNILDIEIDERISGGQKTRLALATRIYRLLKENKKILILDEPEQGSDPEVAYQIIKNIMNLCKDKNIIIIIISHLELIKQKYNWNKFIEIKNGQVELM